MESLQEPRPTISNAGPEKHHHHEGDFGHRHHHGEPSSVALLAPPPVGAGEAAVIPHADLKSFGNQGNTLVGLATASHGAQSFEIWRSEVAPGGATPPHVHDSEEIFIVLRGKGELHVGEEVIPFEAPATVIAPAGVPHQLRNTGDVPTDQIVVVGIASTIRNPDGKVLQLPWRK